MERLVLGEIGTNCYIVPFDGKAIVIDPGDNAALIIRRLADLNLAPSHFLLTHGHFDHLAALPALFRHYQAAGVKTGIAIHKDDAVFLGRDAYKAHCESFSAITGGDTSFVDALWEEMPNPTILLNEGDATGNFRTLHLPGHSRGSAGFYDEKNGVLISGDTLFAGGGIGRSDFPESSEDALYKSVKRLLGLPGATKIYPGHGPASTIEREAAYGII